MTKKKPGAKIGRPKDVKRNEERLTLMADLYARPDVHSPSTAANRASEIEAESSSNPTDPAQFRRLWKQEEDAEKVKGIAGPHGELAYSHTRAEKALWRRLEKEGRAPVLQDGKLSWKSKT